MVEKSDPPLDDSVTDVTRLEIAVNPVQTAEKKARYEFRVNAIQIPILRLLAFILFVLLVLINNLFIVKIPASGAANFAVISLSYALITWALLYLFYQKVKLFNLGSIILITDITIFTFGIYFSGGDKSWLFSLYLLRSGDTDAGSKRSMFYAHYSVLNYLLMLAYLSYIEHQQMEWGAQLSKAAIIYSFCIYFALVSSTKDRMRKSAVKAMRLAREAINQLRISQERAIASEKRALETSESKSIFLSNMSHELRTPLNAILGFAQLMKRDGTLNDKHQETMNIILRSGEHLLGLINNILSIAKIESGKMALDERTFDLKVMITTLKEMFQLQANNKNLPLSFEVSGELPNFVRGDEGKLRQILINLIGNAVKFTDKGAIVVRISWQDGVAKFEVEDSGPGLNREDIDRSFMPFEQTKTGQGAKDGTGLGLAISKNYVNLMGGDLNVESQLGIGSVFSFSVKLPLSVTGVSEKQELKTVIGLEVNQPQYRILVVDDKLENRLLMVRLLTSVGFQVKEAGDGMEAIKVWQDWHPALIFMDIRMPIMDGYQTTRRIREQEAGGQNGYDRSVIIALTASAFLHDREAILDAGCDDFVSKPFREEKLFEKLVEYLQVRFLYQQETAKPTGQSVESALTPAGLAKLPDQWVKQLAQALTIGDNETARAVVEQIEDVDKEMAQKIGKMIKNFQIDELLELIERIPT